jgi:hypothetical protein
MRNGGILSGPSPHDPNVAVRIDGLYPIDTASWDNSVAIHLGNMAIISQPMQFIEKSRVLARLDRAREATRSRAYHPALGETRRMQRYDPSIGLTRFFLVGATVAATLRTKVSTLFGSFDGPAATLPRARPPDDEVILVAPHTLQGDGDIN